MNSILVIHPYKCEGVWVFDDPKVGLTQEPFIAGADVILDRMTAGIPNAEKGVTILFAAIPFPGHQFELRWLREDAGGNVYHCPAFNLEGWLCPALFKYFDAAPKAIYLQVKPKAAV
jgi:hypothetical protein